MSGIYVFTLVSLYVTHFSASAEPRMICFDLVFLYPRLWVQCRKCFVFVFAFVCVCLVFVCVFCCVYDVSSCFFYCCYCYLYVFSCLFVCCLLLCFFIFLLICCFLLCVLICIVVLFCVTCCCYVVVLWNGSDIVYAKGRIKDNRYRYVKNVKSDTHNHEKDVVWDEVYNER